MNKQKKKTAENTSDAHIRVLRQATVFVVIISFLILCCQAIHTVYALIPFGERQINEKTAEIRRFSRKIYPSHKRIHLHGFLRKVATIAQLSCS